MMDTKSAKQYLGSIAGIAAPALMAYVENVDREAGRLPAQAYDVLVRAVARAFEDGQRAQKICGE